ncbi:hypothetical protein KIPB_010442, partial [Kipferlia bialata]
TAPRNVDALCTVIRLCPLLESLDVSGTDIGPGGALAVAQTLVESNIAAHVVSDDSAPATMHSLDMSHINMGDDGLLAVVEALLGLDTPSAASERERSRGSDRETSRLQTRGQTHTETGALRMEGLRLANVGFKGTALIPLVKLCNASDLSLNFLDLGKNPIPRNAKGQVQGGLDRISGVRTVIL